MLVGKSNGKDVYADVDRSGLLSLCRMGRGEKLYIKDILKSNMLDWLFVTEKQCEMDMSEAIKDIMNDEEFRILNIIDMRSELSKGVN
ncbi:hypothetical protein [Clostridium sp.]|uniref:hypothetical protein n=1 Tax=Clostridium sp. TaxID=1506 RepID=UPI003F3284CD